MQEIELPSGEIVEFPDSMPDAQIRDVLRRKGASSRTVASHATVAPPPVEKPGKAESAARGALQGASFGFGDEAAGAVAATLPFTDREAAGEGKTWGERYRNARDFYRGRNVAAEKANPGTYLTGQVAGAVAPTLIGAAPATAQRAMALASGQGAAQGAGYSDAASLGGLAGDTALGAGVGLAGYGAGALLGKGAAALRGKAGRVLSRAEAKAGQQAADESAEAVATAAGRLGGEVQKGSRYVENLLRFEAAGTLNPAQQAELAALRANGTIPKLAESVAQNTLASLPSQAGTIASRQAELAALQQAAPQAVANRTAALLKPSVKADTLSYLKSYAEPMAWALGAQQAGSALGLDPGEQGALAAAAGIIGGRTRAGKAFWNRVSRPGNQAALADAMSRTAARLEQARRPVQAGLTAELIAALEGKTP